MKTRILYKYHDLENLSSTELFFVIMIDETAKQLDVEDIGAVIAILVGQPILKKNVRLGGATKGTSLASKYIGKTLPYKMPFRAPTLIFDVSPLTLKIRMTKNLGRFVGRSVPVVGWIILAYDISKITYNTIKKYNSIVHPADIIPHDMVS